MSYIFTYMNVMYLDSDSEEEQVTMLPSELGYEAKTDLRYDN